MADYYKKNRERLQKRLVKGIRIFLKKKKMCQYTCEQYSNLSEEGKNEKHHYVCEQYENLSEDEKQRLFEYIKKLFFKMKKNKE